MESLTSYEIHHGSGTKVTITDVPSNLSPLASFLKMQVIADEIFNMKQPKHRYSFSDFWRKEVYCTACGISYLHHRDCEKGFI
ncbi:hypothetical protein [Bacillus taeanensis]|uniref:Uncharacterized protein n=1 Tax=Bacillus taeanensis TaxID=273032 RepID=A0A366XVG5_9BACI|nr:hypothetical protein [Bacillus taeanensis]RBW67941.1 hypothetical protein DS031_19230 [Bacillus taeanensis]